MFELMQIDDQIEIQNMMINGFERGKYAKLAIIAENILYLSLRISAHLATFSNAAFFFSTRKL
jgi:hypothetical protein